MAKNEESSSFDINAVVGWVALAIALLQLAFSTPLIYGVYFHPQLRAELISIKKGPFQVRIRIENRGNTSAHEVEVSLAALAADTIKIVPDITNEVTRVADGVFASHKLRLNHLAPGEAFDIVVDGPDDRLKDLPDPEKYAAFWATFIPQITVLRSEEGRGDVGYPVWSQIVPPGPAPAPLPE